MDNPRYSIGSRILRASIVVASAHLILKLLGFIQAVAVGRYLDSATYDVIYAFAFEGVIFSLFLIGEESIGPAFLPVFLGEKEEHGDDTAWVFASTVISLQGCILCAIISLLVLIPDVFITVLTNWREDMDPDTYRLARQSIIWLAPALLCLSLGSTTYMLLNGYKRFFLAAFGDASWKMIVIASLVIGIAVYGFDYRALFVGLLAGSVAKLLTHVIALGSRVSRFHLRIQIRNTALKRFLILILPLFIGIVFAKSRDIYSGVTLLSSLDTPGLMKANSLGRKLFTAIAWLVPYAASIAVFPYFCDLVNRRAKEELATLVTESSRFLLVVFVPLSFTIAVVSEPLSALLFSGGTISSQMTSWIAIVTACYMLALPAYSVEYVFIQGLFSYQRTLTVTVIGIVFSLVVILLGYFLIAVIGLRDGNALVAVAISYGVGRLLKVITLAVFLKQNIPIFPVRETWVFLAKVVGLGLLCALAASIFKHYVEPTAWVEVNKALLLGQMILCAVAVVGVFAFGSYTMRLSEPRRIIRWLTAQLNSMTSRN